MAGRIAVLTFHPPSEIGGVERFVYFLKAGFARQGWEMDVYDASRFGESSSSFLSQQRVSYRIGRALKESGERYDLVLSNGMLGWNVHVSPSVHVYHGTSWGVARGMGGVRAPRTYAEAGMVGSVQEKLCGVGKAVVAVSSRTRQEVESAYRLRVSRVILNAVDLEFFRPLKGKEVLREELGLPGDVFLGLFMDSAGLRKGKDVVEAVARQLPGDCRILAVSRNSFDASSGVLVRSHLPLSVMPLVYNACDFFVFPSRYEGCSYAIIEAMACGLPAVISDVGHAKEIAQWPVFRRLICPDIAAKSVLERIHVLRDDRDLCREAGRQGRLFAERYHSLPGFVNQYRGLFDELIQRR